MPDKPIDKPNAKRIKSSVSPEEVKAFRVARSVMRPTIQAAGTLKEYGKAYGDLDLTGLIDALSEQTIAVNNGDLSRAEAMLAAQAHTLDAIFNNLARRAALNMAEHLQACETYLKLALRSQAQCRATLETLAEIKHPRSVAFVAQANIAQGHQQVNNAPSCAGKTKKAQNKLMEKDDDKRLDTRAARTTGGTDTPLETVGAVHRTKND